MSVNTFTSFGQVIPVLGPVLGFPGTNSHLPFTTVVKRPVKSTATLNLAFGEAAVVVPDSTGGTWMSVKDFLKTVANVANVAQYLAGFALREVKTNLTYPAGIVPGVQQVGYYAPNELAEVMEQSGIIATLAYGTPQSNMPAYVRIAANSTLVGTAVGDIEAAADLVTTTGSISAASATLTVGSGTGIQVGQLVTSAVPAFPDNTYVTVVNSTTITLSQNAFAALSGAAVVFANTLKIPYTVFRTGVVDTNNSVELEILRRNAA